ncbi:MAG TPA: hypothetical protein PK736_00045 [Bacteroidia bacterium]|nr:hypothetical protein [Bacteroidia bacterium]
MKSLFAICLVFMLFTTCNTNPSRKIVGEWKQYYGEADETSFNTLNFTYNITLTPENELKISDSASPERIFLDISFSEDILSFSTRFPGGKSSNTVHYKLKFNSETKLLEGHILSNSSREQSKISWKRVKSSK